MARIVLDTSVLIGIAKNQLDIKEVILDFTAVEAKAFGILEASAVQAGTPMSEFDLVIAAHSWVESAVLVTRDKKARFTELPGVIARVI